MDPRISAEELALTPDSHKTDAGADYLRRLKAQPEGDAPGNPDGSSPSATVPPATATGSKERRRRPRFRCTGSAEFKAEGSDVRMWGTLTDISLNGCYVEMSTTFPVGTKVDLILDAMGVRVRALGVVRVSYPFLGMGISLTHIEPQQLVHVEQLLSMLAGESATPDPASAQASTSETLLAAEPMALLDGIRRFFESNRILTREEFVLIAKQCRRRS